MKKSKGKVLLGVIAALIVFAAAAFTVMGSSDIQTAQQMKSVYTESMRYY